MNRSERVPKGIQERYEEIVSITDSFSRKHLDEEYAQLIRFAVAALSRKRPSPIEKGNAKSWACGVTHAIGMANFLFDSESKPYIRATELYKEFGVGQSTGQGRSKLIRDLLKMNHFEPTWLLRSSVDRNPMIWTLSVNGMLVDIRKMPREAQDVAFEKGLIPYIPDDEDSA
jgi:hypothetical protein